MLRHGCALIVLAFASATAAGSPTITMQDVLRESALPESNHPSPKLRSPDGAYVALIETSAPRAPAADVGAMKRKGVRFIDVGAQADARSRSLYTSRITIRSRTTRVIDLGSDAAWHGEWRSAQEFCFAQVHYWGHSDSPFTRLRCANAVTGELRDLRTFKGAIFQQLVPRFSPDGRWLALAYDVDTGRWDNFVSLMLTDLESGAERRLTFDLYVESVVWARDSSRLYFTARRGGLDQIYEVSLDGEIARVTDGPRKHSDVNLSADGKELSYITDDGLGRRDQRARDLAGGAERVTRTVRDPTRRFALGDFRQVQYTAPDGLQLFGFLITPPAFDPGRRYPVLMDIHGGGEGAPLSLRAPLSVGVAPGPLEWHAWAALGYVVFVPDFRSSGEYGPEVARARLRSRDWSGIEADVRDIEAATGWLVAQLFVDASRVAIFGHSAGGARVNLLLTRSRAYSAAVLHDPVMAGSMAQVLSLSSGVNAGATGFDDYWHWLLGSSFEQDPQLQQNGFMFDGYRNRTPTLILVGNPAHGAVDPQSSEVLFSMLRHAGTPARMLRFPDEGHVARTAAGVMKRYDEARAWIGR